MAVFLDLIHRVGERGFQRVMRNQNELRCGARRGWISLATLDNAFNRNFIVRQNSGNRRHSAGLVTQIKGDIEPALMGARRLRFIFF